MSTKAVPQAVIDAMNRGEKVEAIRLMRETTGLGLKEAKDAVEAFAGFPPPTHLSNAGVRSWSARVTRAVAPGEVERVTATAKVNGIALSLPDPMLAAICADRLFEAIKLLREANPALDLEQAKFAVEGLAKEIRKPRLDVSAAEGADGLEMATPARSHQPTVVAVRGAGSGLRWAVLILAIAAAAWWWFGGR